MIARRSRSHDFRKIGQIARRALASFLKSSASAEEQGKLKGVAAAVPSTTLGPGINVAGPAGTDKLASEKPLLICFSQTVKPAWLNFWSSKDTDGCLRWSAQTTWKSSFRVSVGELGRSACKDQFSAELQDIKELEFVMK